MLTLYGYAKCSTCRKAKRLLIEAGIALQEIDITTSPPSAAILTAAMDCGIKARALLNTSGQQYRLLNMKDRVPTMTGRQLVETLAGNGRLIKRPIVTDGTTFTVGFKEEAFRAAWLVD